MDPSMWDRGKERPTDTQMQKKKKNVISVKSQGKKAGQTAAGLVTLSLGSLREP